MARTQLKEASAEMWWGNFELAEGERLQRQIGGLTLSVQRSAKEWQISAERQEEPGNNSATPQTSNPDFV